MLAPVSAPAIEVVHAVPGRVRFRVRALRRDPALADCIIAAGMAHPGVRRVRINLACGAVVVEGEPRSDVGPGLESILPEWMRHAPEDVARRENQPLPTWRRLAPLGLALAGLGLSVLTAGALPGVATAVTALSAIPIVYRAGVALTQERRPSVDLLDASAVTLMLSLSEFRSAALMCALVALGEEIRERTARRSRRAALSLQGALGRSAWLVQGTNKTQVPVDQLRRGDIVVAYAGDLIPVDGVVVEGSATVDQKTLTGESRPVFKAAGEHVLAATVLTDGKVYVRAEAVGAATRAGLVVRALETAPIHDTRAANYAARFADRLVLPTFGLAGLVWAVTGNVGRAAAILILDFATGIRVSAPTAVLATMTAAARRGILIKGGSAIERLATADAVVFDKTGTLTRGKPRVGQVLSLDESIDPDTLLRLAAAAELRLRHPTARALVRHARRRELTLPEREDSHYTAAHGVVARVEGRRVRVGNARFFEGAGIDLGRAARTAERLGAVGQSIVYVAVDEELAGLISYVDPPRPQAAQLVAWLTAHGVRELYMVSGDEPAAAEPVAAALGIPHVYAAALPDEKATIVRELQRRGHTVAVVGDGINDSPALAVADVSISLKSGADVARDTADVVLMESGQLMRIAEAIELSRSCLGLIRQNLFVVGGSNGAAFAAAGAVGISPIVATMINNGSTVLAGLNSLRPLLAPRRRQHMASFPAA